MKKIALIGPGRIGQTVARLLCEAGHEIVAVISRDQHRAVTAARFIGSPGTGTTDLARAWDAELVLIALPDDYIAKMASALRKRKALSPKAVLVHFSGLHSADILLDGDTKPNKALALHPLQTFADSVVGVRSLPGSPVSVEGTSGTLELGEALVKEMGGIPVPISKEQKPLYHAAACVASNYMVALLATAGQMMQACGFDEQQAQSLLLPILKGTANNLATLGPTNALTGPIARGDVRTIEKHLQALESLPADLQEIYRVLGKKTVEVAKKKGTLSPEAEAEILRLLQ